MTVKMIKLELKKAFTTPWFYLSLAVVIRLGRVGGKQYAGPGPIEPRGC